MDAPSLDVEVSDGWWNEAWLGPIGARHLVTGLAALVNGASYAHAEALSGVPSTTLQ